MVGPVGPSGVNPTPFSNPFQAENFQLPDTLVQLQGQSSVSLNLQAGHPTLLGYTQTIGDAQLAVKQEKIEFELDSSNAYKDAHLDIVLTAINIRDILHTLQEFKISVREINDDLKALNEGTSELAQAIQAFNNGHAEAMNLYNNVMAAISAYQWARNRIDTINQELQNNPNDPGNPSKIFERDSLIASIPALQQAYLDAGGLWNNYINVRNPQIQALNDAYTNKVNELNGKIAEINAKIGPLNTIKYPKVLEADDPGILEADDPGFLDADDPDGTIGSGPHNPASEFIFPPMPPVPQVQGLDYLGATLPDNNWNNPPYAISPPTHPVLAPTTLNYSFTFDKDLEEKFNASFVQPFLNLLKEGSDLLQKIADEVAFQDLLTLAFGQTYRYASIREQTASETPVGVGGSGSSVVLATLSSNQRQNVHFAENFTKSTLEAIYNVNGVPSGSPLIASIDNFVDDILEYVLYSSLAEGIQIAGTALTGISPNTSPSVLAGVSIGFLGGVSNFVQNGSFEAVLTLLKGSEELIGKTDAELVEMAKGISSALNMELMSIAIRQVALAIGSANLLPQLLDSLGSLTQDSINRLIIGDITYKNLLDNPFQQSLAINTLSEALRSERNIARARADTIAQNSLREALAAETDDIRASLVNALRDNLIREGIDNANAASEAAALALEENYNRSQEYQELLKAESFRYELANELLKAGQEKEEVNQILAGLKGNRVDDLEALANTSLASDQAGLSAVQTALANVNNPLRSFLVQPLSDTEIANSLESLASNALNQPGADRELTLINSRALADQLITSPNSIRNLIRLNLDRYSEAIGKAQEEAADEFFAGTIAPSMNFGLRAQELFSPANFLVFADRVSVAGFQGSHMGAGTPAGFGYMNNDQTPV